jgi:hypothetical protein
MVDPKMGKKSKRNKPAPVPRITPEPEPSDTSTPAVHAAPPPAQTQMAPVFYPSDGPSDIELLQTTSPTLQVKLDQLTQLGLDNNRQGFVEQFVPLDLSREDIIGYLQDLTIHPEAEGQWTNLISEIAAIRCGRGVNKIEGDQIKRAIFFFSHPLLEACNREVAFICTRGEWRAEG